MIKRIFISLVGLLTLALSVTTAVAQQNSLPAGYVLVPLSGYGNSFLPSYPAGSAYPTVNSAAVVSAAKSTLRASEEVGIVNRDSILVTATIRDDGNNPLAGRTISLISSRATDEVRVVQATTNTNGEALFMVTASEEGISSLAALDQQSGTAVGERPRIVFLKKASSVSGNALRSDLLLSGVSAQGQNYEKKLVVDFPQLVSQNDSIDVTVSVTSNTDVPDEAFAGTITFDTNDEDALLPRDYTFKEIDRGTHVFAKAVTFSTPGKKTILISALGNDNIAPANLEIEVLGKKASGTAPVITSPSKNFLTNKIVPLTGTAAPNVNLAVFVDGQLFTQGETDAQGDFIINTDLDEGSYEVAVAVLNVDNSVGLLSSTIKINVDTTPPALAENSVRLDPDKDVEPGTSIKISLESESKLPAVTVSYADQTLSLVEGVRGIYAGTITTTEPGTLSFGVELTDAAGNTTKRSNVANLVVVEPPPVLTITEIKTAPKSKQVDVSWTAPANQADVDHYVIAYGPTKENLTQELVTTDNRTAWSIGDLNNDTAYFFKIKSYRADNKQNGFSEPFSATPMAELALQAIGCDSEIRLTWKEQADPQIAAFSVEYGITPGQFAEKRLVPNTGAANQYSVRDLINGVTYYFTIRGINASGQIIFDPGEAVSGTPQVGACYSAPPEVQIQLWQKENEKGEMILVWTPVSGAAGYRVYAGTQPNFFDLPVVTVDTPYFKPEGLTANQDYYFSVRAFYNTGQEAATFSNITKVEVGPAEVLIISVLLALTTAWFWHRKNFLKGRFPL